MATAGVNYVSTLAPKEKDWFLGYVDPIVFGWGPDIDTATQDALDTYNTAVANANVIRVTTIGNVELTQAVTDGGAEVTLGTEEGGIETALVSGIGTESEGLATELEGADELFTETVTNDAADMAVTLAEDAATWTDSYGTDDGQAQTALGTEETSVATNIANAEADYAIAIATAAASAAVGYASAYQTPASTFQAAWAQAYVDWLTNLRAAFVADSTTTAQDDANYQQTIAGLGDSLADKIATEQITFTQTDAPAAAIEAQAVDAADDDYSVSIVDHLTNDANLTAAADGTWDIGLATAASMFLQDNAQADKDSQIAYAQVPLGGSAVAARALYIKETADAQLTLTTSQANADQGWITSKAAADSGFLNDDATAWDGMVHTEATAADDFAHTDDEAAQTEADDIGADEADTIVPEAQADETQATADGGANANFMLAQASQTSIEWSSLASSLDTPWAQEQAAQASALAGWGSTEASNYLAYITKLNTAETGYASSDITQFTGEFQKIDLADFTDGNAMADADEVLANTLADDEMGTEQAVADADDPFWVSVGEAKHDYRVAQAEAIHDAIVGGPLADFNAAMTLAAANQSSALNGAIAQFHLLVDPAVALQTTDDASATFTDDQAFDDAELDDTTQADEAIDTYSDL
ncbi:MAG TPA: hypothetical protein VFX03_07405, partial [Thermomicrobiales bacterium]|nr:hypothetical protein [Thermomicrobiales bacterium]